MKDSTAIKMRLLELRPSNCVVRDGAFHLTREDELDLATMDANGWGGEMLGRIMRNGIRDMLPHLFGSAVVWDAPETRFVVDEKAS